MAVVKPILSERQQAKICVGIFVGGIVGALMVGVVGPIILAILVGEVWGH